MTSCSKVFSHLNNSAQKVHVTTWEEKSKFIHRKQEAKTGKMQPQLQEVLKYICNIWTI